MAGALFVTQDEGKWYVLLARESSGLGWRDLGGLGEPEEDPLALAARMLTRNTMGLVGGTDETRMLVGESQKIVRRCNYTCFVIVTRPEPALPTYIRRAFRHEEVRNERHSGQLVFDNVAWVPMNGYPPHLLRSWFRPIFEEVRRWTSTQRVEC